MLSRAYVYDHFRVWRGRLLRIEAQLTQAANFGLRVQETEGLFMAIFG